MKIALVAKAIYPARGGVELHVHNLARSLAGLGHKVQTFVEAGPKDEYAELGFRVSTGVSSLTLVSELRREEFSALHAHGARTPIAAWALLAGKRLGLRTVFTPHCFYPAQSWRGRLKRALFDPTLGQLALGQADHIVCLTENDRADALACGAAAGRIRIVPNSIRMPEVPSPEAVAEFRRRRGMGRFLLSVGRLDRVKRGDFLVSALPLLPDDLELVFIGPDAGCLAPWGELAKRLGVGGRVHFLLEVSDDELRCAYRASAALVMASAYEGLPTVLLEAMALGTPVIAAQTGGIGCLVQDQRNGLLFAAGDLPGFCAQVHFCLAGVAREMLVRARDCVERQYCWDVNAIRIAALYDGHGG